MQQKLNLLTSLFQKQSLFINTAFFSLKDKTVFTERIKQLKSTLARYQTLKFYMAYQKKNEDT